MTSSSYITVGRPSTACQELNTFLFYCIQMYARICKHVGRDDNLFNFHRSLRVAARCLGRSNARALAPKYRPKYKFTCLFVCVLLHLFTYKCAYSSPPLQCFLLKLPSVTGIPLRRSFQRCPEAR